MSEDPEDRGWLAVRHDVVDLIREVGGLQVELSNAQEKARKEQKQLLLDCLDVLDGFDRVFANIAPREASADRQTRIWIGNFRAVRKMLDNHLKSRGVVVIEAPEGKAVPGFHTIVGTEEQLDLEDGTILTEQRKGYMWKGDVLRRSLVIAVKN